jgi:4-amino-4-deoxy-L-arabinose transferase-like glycosyltransferase
MSDLNELSPGVDLASTGCRTPGPGPRSGPWVWTKRKYYLLLAGFTVVHMMVAAVLPVSGDEAYYWDLSRVWDWSTFDQPSLMIWAMVPFRLVLGETALAVRAPALIASFLIGVFLLPLVRRLGGNEGSAARIYTLLHGMPLFFVGSGYLSTDIGMMAAIIAAVWAAVAIAQGERRAWWGFGLATGLGFLAKFPIVVTALPALGAALVRREVRRDLLTPTPYLAALLSFACTVPVWIWGFQHGFDNIAFQLQARHSLGGLTLRHLLVLVGANAFFASPPLFVVLALAWWRSWKRQESGWPCLLVAAASPFVFFGLVSLREKVGAHWGAPGLLLAGVALGLITRWPCRRTVAVGMVFGLLTSALLVGLAAGVEPLVSASWGPFERLRPGFARQVAPAVGNDELIAELRTRRRSGELIVSEGYTEVHLVAFLAGGSLPTRLAKATGGKHGLASLYWYRPSELKGRDFLLITEQGKVETRVPRLFESATRESPIVITRGGVIIREMQVWRCRNLLRPEGVFTRLPEE